ncbi:MAG: class I SAM-dependent methyltransferase [Paracoccaceae bacterium]
MDRAVYARMGAAEAEHWWFRGRRAVLETLIARNCALPANARLLEAGCGTGGNLAMLARHGQLDAFEYDADARQEAASKGIVQIAAGALPDDVTAADGVYDLIALFDVLEHIEEDRASLMTLGTKLASKGHMLISVPAMPWLWSRHDEIHHHKRRYTKGSLRAVIAEAGLTVEAIGYFNTLLFPLAVAQRMVQRLTGHEAPADAIPAPWLNSALGAIFRAERHLVGRLPMPAGLSLYAIVTRN